VHLHERRYECLHQLLARQRLVRESLDVLPARTCVPPELWSAMRLLSERQGLLKFLDVNEACGVILSQKPAEALRVGDVVHDHRVLKPRQLELSMVCLLGIAQQLLQSVHCPLQEVIVLLDLAVGVVFLTVGTQHLREQAARTSAERQEDQGVEILRVPGMTGFRLC